MPNVPLPDNFKVSYQVPGLDSDGAPTGMLGTGSTLTVVSSAPDSVSVAQDATSTAPGMVATGFLVGGKAVQTGVVITFTLTLADGSKSSQTVSVDDIAGAASSLGPIVLGTPIPQ
jgi:hypothetical protein